MHVKEDRQLLQKVLSEGLLCLYSEPISDLSTRQESHCGNNKIDCGIDLPRGLDRDSKSSNAGPDPL